MTITTNTNYMKKNLQLTALALALCCFGVNAQTGRVVAGKNGINTTTSTKGTNAHGNHTDATPTRKCGTEIPHGEWDNWTAEQIEIANKVNFTKIQPNGNAKEMAVYTIPVIFHIIHGGTAVGSGINISQAQINDQLTILNNDYKSAGLNNTNCPAAFAPVKADCQITFCLATKNPTGGILAEPGIDRRAYTSITGLAAPGAGYSQATCDGTIKPNTIWDPIRYFNVWVTALGGGLLGYATFPVGTSITCITGSETNQTSGVVCGSQYIGSIGSATTAAPYNKGRTLVHEAGHWLGLRHINGDATCGNDCCNDTPTQDALHGGCPTFPYHTTQCTGNTPNGEMFMNYMDYTDDACMYMFTLDQKARMQQCMVQGTYRNQLTTSAATLCVLTATAPSANFSTASTACVGSAITTTNNSTGIPTPTYSWSAAPASVTFAPSNTNATPSITFGSTGNYVITLVATNSLGANSYTQSVSVSTCAAVCTASITNVQTTATLNLATAGSDTTTPGCSPKAGYIFGSNCYQDREKAEFFAQSMYASIATPKIKSVMVLFFKNGTQGTGGAAATPVNLKLYNGTMAGGPTGTTSPIGTATANLGLITATTPTTSVSYCGAPVVFASPIIIPYKYTFAVPPNAPATNGFFASVTTPTTAGDTAVILSDNTLTTGTNWENWTPSGWYNVSPTWGGFDAAMAIIPEITCLSTGLINESVLAQNVTLMPNPTSGQVNIAMTLPNATDITLTVTNALGQVITKAEIAGVTNNYYTIDLSSYNNGVYFIELQGKDEKVVKRVILNK